MTTLGSMSQVQICGFVANVACSLIWKSNLLSAMPLLFTGGVHQVLPLLFAHLMLPSQCQQPLARLGFQATVCG